MEQHSLLGLSEHLKRISKIGDPIDALKATVDPRLHGTSMENFRGWLLEVLDYGEGANSRRSPCQPARKIDPRPAPNVDPVSVGRGGELPPRRSWPGLRSRGGCDVRLAMIA